MSKVIKTILLFLLLQASAEGQVDPHFSQYYAYPLWLNPGLTGTMDGGYRFTAIYRNQWSSVMTPFTTMGISADVASEKNLNLGLNFLNQTAGEAGYQYLNAYASIAYSGVKFGKDKSQQIIFGLQAGLLSRRFDASKFQFGDQWNPVTGFDPNVATADVLTRTSASVLDVGAGISYLDGTSDKRANVFAGAGLFHLTRPQDPFVAAGAKQTLPVRMTFHAGCRINITDVFSLTPHGLYMKQGNANEKMAGLYGSYLVNERTSLFLGANYRVEDAIVPLLGVEYSNWRFGFSYDLTLSELGKAVPGTNSLEFSMTYTGRKSGKPLRYLSCPRF
jgi:type IX secretion system PorP/SprF family membrane protein